MVNEKTISGVSPIQSSTYLSQGEKSTALPSTEARICPGWKSNLERITRPVSNVWTWATCWAHACKWLFPRALASPSLRSHRRHRWCAHWRRCHHHPDDNAPAQTSDLDCTYLQAQSAIREYSDPRTNVESRGEERRTLKCAILNVVDIDHRTAGIAHGNQWKR